jgi:plastocyanin
MHRNELKTKHIVKTFLPLIENLSLDELSDLNLLVTDRMEIMLKANTLFSMAQFTTGDRVRWTGNDGKEHNGIITKFNQRSVIVMSSENARWKISPELLTRIV